MNNLKFKIEDIICPYCSSPAKWDYDSTTKRRYLDWTCPKCGKCIISIRSAK